MMYAPFLKELLCACCSELWSVSVVHSSGMPNVINVHCRQSNSPLVGGWCCGGLQVARLLMV